MIIDQEIRAKMDKLREHLPTEQSLLLPLLHAMQAKEGWISTEAMREAATYLQLAPARVQEVVSFYTMYNRKPVGKKHVQVCTNVACFLRGADKLVTGLEERLGIHCGQTTKDGKYTLTEVECLAACGTAPVMQVNDDYYENLDENSVNTIMDKLDSELRHG
ncbi:MAG: NADH-quinone oxidoreductase subunit NuoE [Bdellovibrionota bacterium]|nr:MAG: NADH-quinone oxidoreductase subunit NuoE [Pseudomonadota bacterium]